MSRNPLYQFVDTDTTRLEAALVDAYEAIVGHSAQPSSPERIFIAWVASIILQERVYLNHAGNQNIPSRAEGANLDALGELFYQHMPGRDLLHRDDAVQYQRSARPAPC